MRRAAPAALAALASLVLAGCLGPAPPAGDARPASVVSGAVESTTFQSLWCPYLLAPHPEHPLEVCNSRASAAAGPASEMDLAMDPRDPLHLVTVAKAYNYTRTLYDEGEPSLSEHRDVITNYASSFDGGRTWTEGYLQAFAPAVDTGLGWGLGGSEEQGSDPVVEFAPDGSVLAVTLRVTQYPSADSLPVWRSTDGGLTFERFSDAYHVGRPDKQWVVTDHERGVVYVATSDFGASSGVYVVRSLDGGLTWSERVKVCSCFHPGIDVGPGGEVYVSAFGSGGVVFARSLDGGATWSAPVRIAALTGGGNQPSKLFRTPNIPVLAASKVDGGVYVAYATRPPDAPPACQRFTALCDDVYLAISADGGATWRNVRINDDGLPLAEQFMPTVAVSPNGRDVHVAWMDQRHDPGGLTMHTYYAHSADGGASWDANLRVSEVPSQVLTSFHQNPLPVITNGWFVGDYIGLAASDERAVIAFPDTRYGRADVAVATVV